jgi:hypothetical protein
MMARRNQNGLNGAAGNDNDLFRNTDDNNLMPDGLENIADNEEISLTKKFKENFVKNLEWVKEFRHTGEWLKDFAINFGGVATLMYWIPTAKVTTPPDTAYPSAEMAGGIAGAAGLVCQAYLYCELSTKTLGQEGGRFNWEYLMIPVATNLIDYVLVEPLRKSMNEVKEEKERRGLNNNG